MPGVSDAAGAAERNICRVCTGFQDPRSFSDPRPAARRVLTLLPERDVAQPGQSAAFGRRKPSVRIRPSRLTAQSCQSPWRRRGTVSPPLGHSVDFELVAADHEVGVHGRLVDAARVALVGGERGCPVDGLQDGRADRDVRGRVLVEQRVVEHEPGRRRPGSDRRRAPPRRVVAAPSSVAMCVRMTSSPDEARTSTARPAFEADLEVAHDRPLRSAAAASSARVPSVRRASGVVKTSSVGMFAMCSMPADVSSAVCQTRTRGGGRSSGRFPAPGSAADRKRRSFRAAARAARLPMWCAPGGGGVGFVEPHRGGDGGPEALDVGLAEDRARPAFVREGRRSSSWRGRR